MAVFNLNSSRVIAKILILMHFRVPMILVLTCLQDARVNALPTGNATEFSATHIPTNGLATSTQNNISSIQYPPTTIVQNTIPGTKGVSGCPGRKGVTRGPWTDGLVNVN